LEDQATMSAQEKISEFLCREFFGNDRSKLPGLDEPLMGSDGGAVDSVGLHQVITFLESDLGVVVNDLDIVPENFATTRALFRYVEGNLAQKKA
jgi:acyl carrier protein